MKRARTLFTDREVEFFNSDSHWTVAGGNVLYETEILKRYPVPEHMKENAGEDLLHTILL